jgi:AcrR family transcriptional regulator
MGRRSTHDVEVMLDTTRELLLTNGARATNVAAIAAASGAPVGTLYHRFGSRDALLAEVWLRALSSFQERFLSAAHEDDHNRAGGAMAAAVVRFSREQPADARVLLSTRVRDLLDRSPSVDYSARLAALNKPIEAAIGDLARACFKGPSKRSIERVRFAVVDLPAGVVRRHAEALEDLPQWLEAEVAAAAQRILSAPTPPSAPRC